MLKWTFVVFWFTVAALPAQTVAGLKLNDVRTDRAVSFADYSGYKVLVMVFTTNDCPFDERYRERLFQLARQYEGRVPFLFINSSSDPEETPAAMKALHSEIVFPAPYLEDKEQAAMKIFNVRKSPECLVVRPEGQSFAVLYRGAIDDNPQSEADVREAYLANAIEKVLAGQPVEVSEHRPPGCSIR
ncbi:MAG: hypothetical protein KatS3mg032_1949 [Cyclobacteriaceae bacterium]|nr:MAG: hypothetical protein KatS3mg032_1949 [Cyclobacteriaceae bacterium]